MIRLEVLYPEYMNLYGDRGNVKYLEQCIPNLEIIYTSLKDKPSFLSKKIDILYLGPSTESNQEEIVKLLMPYKKNIKELINNNVLILAIGNALEIFGEYIETSDNRTIKCLGLYNVYSKRFDDFRYNEKCLGVFNNIDVVGFKNQLSHLYGDDKHYFLDISIGTGRNKGDKKEGLFDHNFIGTYLLGPILPLNPNFTEYILKSAKIKVQNLPYKEDMLKAYEKRKEEFIKK